MAINDRERFEEKLEQVAKDNKKECFNLINNEITEMENIVKSLTRVASDIKETVKSLTNVYIDDRKLSNIKLEEIEHVIKDNKRNCFNLIKQNIDKLETRVTELHNVSVDNEKKFGKRLGKLEQVIKDNKQECSN